MTDAWKLISKCFSQNRAFFQADVTCSCKCPNLYQRYPEARRSRLSLLCLRDTKLVSEFARNVAMSHPSKPKPRISEGGLTMAVSARLKKVCDPICCETATGILVHLRDITMLLVTDLMTFRCTASISWRHYRRKTKFCILEYTGS